MRCMLLLTLFAIAGWRPALAQEVIVEPVLGQIQMDNDGIWSCQLTASQLCSSCVEDADDPGSIPPLVLAFGTTGLRGWSFGTLTGTIQLAAEVDGLTIPPSLLPCDARFTSRIGVGALFVPNSPCGVQGLDYVINSMAGQFTGGGNQEISIPAQDADLVSFEFTFCNVSAHWGAGCNLTGSFNDRWLLRVPGDLSAADVGSGDAPPVAFPTQGITLDFLQGPGGRVTVLRSELAAPGGTAPQGPAGYWEVTTNMVDGTYDVAVTLAFDASALPPEINPAGLMIARFDRTENQWGTLASVVDLTAETVTATTNALSKLVLTSEMVVRTTPSSWGAVKARY